ncbi:NADH-quinone oxidoreductase subunit NuoK [Neorickettsia risticii]|uniref:NADH-quinone oxidoreductase subunit K n=1 Tax=Neorickettsia risticii (strain Illinois) TaxID=434131 RepID=C6V3P3_NEORI|nr:NADH-quinone oxidoreductase subunit NuoK [Neorickettsia risticii]ACT69010.1 NADH dehydrogenase i, k subunit [Neorickettsia risticii str. Illinois]
MSPSFALFFVSTCFFSIGLFGVLTSTRNIVTMLLAVEIMLLGAILSFCSASSNAVGGQVFSILVITVAAAEAAVALAVVVLYFKKAGNVDVKKLNKLGH